LHGKHVCDMITSGEDGMISTFGDDITAALYHGKGTRYIRRFPPDILSVVLRKLDMLNAAYRLNDLREPPENRLKLLKGDLAGYYSIRVNDQWRIIFRWVDNNARDVSLTDYH
jgi:proteic killer suppression protein